MDWFVVLFGETAKYVGFIADVQTLPLGTRPDETLFRSNIRPRTVRYLNTYSTCG